MKRYFTYNKFGVVTKHKYLLLAMIKARYQSLLLGVSSYVDVWNGDYNKPIRYYKGWLPFK